MLSPSDTSQRKRHCPYASLKPARWFRPHAASDDASCCARSPAITAPHLTTARPRRALSHTLTASPKYAIARRAKRWSGLPQRLSRATPTSGAAHSVQAWDASSLRDVCSAPHQGRRHGSGKKDGGGKESKGDEMGVDGPIVQVGAAPRVLDGARVRHL
ncbi:hypothetical protein B0H10DRAFT_2227130 [Mycena sp. CBHHK59/15]|nr:hypothetical protein B0H10DRAFT_2227130 [Mycena sp. CBHHK59/15]